MPEIARTILLIDDARISDLCVRLPPVILVEGGYSQIKPVDPVNVAFTWSPVPMGPVLDLEAVGTLKSYHNWGYYGFFKPSLKEAYSFISDELLERTGATYFHLDSDDSAPLLSCPDEVNRDGYHTAIVTLLRAKT